MNPKVGQSIEFLSDAMTDKGPAAGKIIQTKITVDGLYVTVAFADSQQMFSWDDMDKAGADIRGDLWMIKSHVQGYSRKDGVYVAPHERQGSARAVKNSQVYNHPRLSETGHKIEIKQPTHPSAPSTWHNPHAVATFVPNGDVPLSINGVALQPWRDHPQTLAGWGYIDGVNDDIDEPEFDLPDGKKASSGVIIQEPDGRVWTISPTNRFGGYDVTFPKGTEEPGLSLQANAIKEVFEESGLKVEISGFIGDFDRTTSKARMYWGRRVGGTPVAAGWETQAVHLTPKDQLYSLLNMWPDHAIAEHIGAGTPLSKKSKNTL